MFTTTSATVERSVGSKGFGFLRALHQGAEINLLIRQERFFEASLKPSDFKKGDLVSVDFEKNRDGLYRVVKIHSVKGEAVKLAATRTVHIEDFLSPVKVAENLATGEVLWRIENPQKEIVQYVVCDLVSNVRRQLGRVSSNEARQNIGLAAKASKAVTVTRKRKGIFSQPILQAAE